MTTYPLLPSTPNTSGKNADARPVVLSGRREVADSMIWFGAWAVVSEWVRSASTISRHSSLTRCHLECTIANALWCSRCSENSGGECTTGPRGNRGARAALPEPARVLLQRVNLEGRSPATRATPEHGLHEPHTARGRAVRNVASSRCRDRSDAATKGKRQKGPVKRQDANSVHAQTLPRTTLCNRRCV